MHEIVCIDTPGLLREMGQLIAKGWIQKRANDTDDHSTATQFCAGGAIANVTRNRFELQSHVWRPDAAKKNNLYYAFHSIGHYVAQAMGVEQYSSKGIPEWNDEPERTSFEVQSAFELAALLCERDMENALTKRYLPAPAVEVQSEELVLA